MLPFLHFWFMRVILIVSCAGAAPPKGAPSRDRLESPVQGGGNIEEELEVTDGGFDGEDNQAHEEELPPAPIPQGGFTATSLFSICRERYGEEGDGLPLKPSRSSSSMKRAKLM